MLDNKSTTHVHNKNFLIRIFAWLFLSGSVDQPISWKSELKSLAWAIGIAMVFRTVLFQPFIIPSGSMKPNLLISDLLFVSKYSYGYSHYALPFSPPFFKGRIFMNHKPQIGDVAVFRGPYDPDTDYIKRVVGLPGDRIQMKEGILYINDQPCPVEPMTPFIDDLWTDRDPTTHEEIRIAGQENERHIPMYVETLPNGVRHPIIKLERFGHHFLDNTQEYIVPQGHYFMMGDNRDESGDSRILRQIGYVPEENLIGQAKLIWFSTTAQWWEIWKWFTHIRFKRLFQSIH